MTTNFISDFTNNSIDATIYQKPDWTIKGQLGQSFMNASVATSIDFLSLQVNKQVMDYTRGRPQQPEVGLNKTPELPVNKTPQLPTIKHPYSNQYTKPYTPPVGSKNNPINKPQMLQLLNRKFNNYNKK